MLAIDANSGWVYLLASLVALVLLWVGFRLGRLVSSISHKGQLASREQEMLIARRGFRTLYEQECHRQTQVNREWQRGKFCPHLLHLRSSVLLRLNSCAA